MFIVMALTSIGSGGCGVEVGARAVTTLRRNLCRQKGLGGGRGGRVGRGF